MTRPLLDEVLVRVAALESDVKAIAARHESAPSRLITLEQSYDGLSALSIDQDELFREALRAIENGLYRAAHVLGWAGFIDFLHAYLWLHHETPLLVERSAWNLRGPDDFRDQTDFAVIESGRVVGAYGRTVMKALHGLLNKRNECAHPSDYYPDLNGALGYLSDVLGRIRFLQGRVAK
jgi:hypothetical protein